jgi:hypothetical protein
LGTKWCATTTKAPYIKTLYYFELRWSRFLRQAVKVDLLTKRMIHHEDTQTVYS